MKYGKNTYFKGTFENGAPVKGQFHYENGDTYEGDIKYNKPEGTGVWKDSTGVYEGQFNNGNFIHGKIQYTDGSRYNGYISEGEKHGVHS